MKEIINAVLTFVGIIGLFVMGLAQVGAIGYFLYLWGGTGMAIGASAWAGFVFWLKIMGVGFLTFIVGIIGSVATDE